MSAGTWPASLPQYPLRQGFTVAPMDNVARAPVELGPAKQRPRSTAALVRVSCRVKVGSETERDTLMAFHDTTLAQGALRFTWAKLTDRLSGSFDELQFTAPPRYRPEGATRWLFDLELLALPA